MNKEVKTIQNVELENIERMHIACIASIGCSGIKCSECPLYENGLKLCLKSVARGICLKNNIAHRWE